MAAKNHLNSEPENAWELRHDEILGLLADDKLCQLLSELREKHDMPEKEFQQLVIEAVESVADAEVIENTRFDDHTCREKLREELLASFGEIEQDHLEIKEASARIKATVEAIPAKEMDRLLHDEVEHHVMVENQTRGKPVSRRLLKNFLQEAHDRIFGALKEVIEGEALTDLLREPEVTMSKLREKLTQYHVEEMQIIRFERFEEKGMPMPVLPSKDELVSVKVQSIRRTLGADEIKRLEKKMQKVPGNPRKNFEQLLHDVAETDHEVEGILDWSTAKTLLEKLIDRQIAAEASKPQRLLN